LTIEVQRDRGADERNGKHDLEACTHQHLSVGATPAAVPRMDPLVAMYWSREPARVGIDLDCELAVASGMGWTTLTVHRRTVGSLLEEPQSRHG
jgi:hypothetical protein